MFAFSTPDVIKAAQIVATALDRLTITLQKVGSQMSTDVQSLVDEVAAVKAVQASAVTLIQGIVAKLEAAQGDSAAIQQAIQDLKDGTQPLADAVAQNTPASPTT